MSGARQGWITYTVDTTKNNANFTGSSFGLSQSLFGQRKVLRESKQAPTAKAAVKCEPMNTAVATGLSAASNSAAAKTFPQYACVPPPRYNDVNGAPRVPTFLMVLPPPRYNDKDGISRSAVVELQSGLVVSHLKK